jgi:hypothetical protein
MIPQPTGKGDTPDAYRLEKRNVFGGPAHHVFGPAIPAHGGIPDGYVMPPDIKGGYAFTPGIPADFWETWVEQNKRADYVVNEMIFAMPDMSEAKKKAVERAELKSGLEPMGREIDEKTGMLKDRRIPRPLNANVGRIAFDAERSGRQSTDE